MAFLLSKVVQYKPILTYFLIIIRQL
ncbi:MAG: hypothetical protein ACJAYN_003384 [Bermanella sp.]